MPLLRLSLCFMPNNFATGISMYAQLILNKLITIVAKERFIIIRGQHPLTTQNKVDHFLFPMLYLMCIVLNMICSVIYQQVKK